MGGVFLWDSAVRCFWEKQWDLSFTDHVKFTSYFYLIIEVAMRIDRKCQKNTHTYVDQMTL